MENVGLPKIKRKLCTHIHFQIGSLFLSGFASWFIQWTWIPFLVSLKTEERMLLIGITILETGKWNQRSDLISGQTYQAGENIPMSISIAPSLQSDHPLS